MATLTLPPTLTDKLAAVNVLLQVLGESPVSSLEASEAVDVSAALNCLDEFDLAVQAEGWSWNREEGLTLTPDTSGTISLPSNCIMMVAAYSSSANTPMVVERGRKLYNKDDHTYTFTDPVTVDLILRLTWEELPEYARRYITIWAAQQFQARLQTSTTVDRITDEVVAKARSVCGHREDEAEERNAVSGNNQTLSRLHGRARRRLN